jgi:hypothetical protein
MYKNQLTSKIPAKKLEKINVSFGCFAIENNGTAFAETAFTDTAFASGIKKLLIYSL